jgi:hypothetical protein
MITQTEIKAMSDHLTDALTKEDLGRRDAARLLNLNPCYITMGMNPKFWDSMSKFAKDRIKEWHDSRDSISAFRIPEGEEIWKPAEKESKKVIVDGNPKPLPSLPSDSEVLPQGREKSAGKPEKAKGKKKVSKWRSVNIDNTIPGKKEPVNGSVLEAAEALPLPIKQRFTIDLEINLFINGQKIQL